MGLEEFVELAGVELLTAVQLRAIHEAGRD